MILRRDTRPRTTEVGCTVEIEESPTSLHAHVDLEGVEVGPGDSVLVHDAPVDPGEGHRLCHRRATVVRAGPLERFCTRLFGTLEFEALYEVGFSSRRIR